MTELLTTDELAIAKRLAGGDSSVKADAKAIYLKYIAAHIEAGRKSAAMNFLSECFQVSPDFNLKALYRQRLLAQK